MPLYQQIKDVQTYAVCPARKLLIRPSYEYPYTIHKRIIQFEIKVKLWGI